ncbi:MAG: hypothetical protein IJ727_08545 [Treponema sp.]|nr:hypothetical protein [Treponema sp.]
MKVPSNFSANATKKISSLEEAIAGNFTKEQSQKINEPVVSQPTTLTVAAKEEKKEATATKPRREIKEKFLVSMSKGERSIYKAFCAMQNVSMNHFVMCAMDYFKEDLENGKVSLSSHSYKRKES